MKLKVLLCLFITITCVCPIFWKRKNKKIKFGNQLFPKTMLVCLGFLNSVFCLKVVWKLSVPEYILTL
jgi:hypothetical protein